jgi:hypothetical protein
MKMYFSPTTNAFYPEEYEKAYKTSGNWPDDLVKVTKEDFNVYGLQTPPEGKTRSFVEGALCWVEYEYSIEQVKQAESLWVETEINRVRDELEKVQDSDSKAFGSVSDWRSYRKALRSWQEHKDFPNKEFRPKAPDA